MKKLIFATLLAASALAHAAGESITVFKDEHCGCCAVWVDHLKAAGYQVTTVNAPDLVAVKKLHGVKDELASCHTAVVDETGQVIEGHVPAAAVAKLISQPSVKGVAVPGMPMNAPGMGKLNGQLVTVDFDGKPFSKD